MILFMFLASMTMVISIDNNDYMINVKARKYVENRPIVPVYTEKGLEWNVNDDKAPNGRGKPEKPPGKPDKPDEPDPGDGIVRKWALCVGIADYEGTEDDLQYPDDDAMDWRAVLNSEGYSVTVLTDGQAEAANIDAAIDDLLASEDADDYVVFTYSGHGIKYRRYGSCILSHDYYLMSHGWFKSKFKNAESQHIYFTFDACEIGGFKDSVDTNRLGAYASNNQYSYDGDSSMKNGVFTYYQIEGWNIYDTFEEDSEYAIQGMNDWASQYLFVTVDPFYADQFDGYMYP